MAKGELRAKFSHTLGAFSVDVEISVGKGITVLFGPSGAGKSTTLAIIAGLVTPNTGKITLDRDTWLDTTNNVSLPAHARRVALVFQSLALFPHMTAVTNVMYGIDRALPIDERREKAIAMLDRLHVKHVASRKPATFSGGEAQRVALARALAIDPRLVLLDEPFSALDRVLRDELGDTVRTIADERDVPFLFVTHDAKEAERLGTRAIVMDRGRVVREGEPAEVIKKG